MKREAFLARVRSALGRDAASGCGSDEVAAADSEHPHAHERSRLLDAEFDAAAALERFRVEAQLAGAFVHDRDSPAAAQGAVREILRAAGVRSVAVDAPDDVLAVVPDDLEHAEATVAEAGITGVRCAIADTGTIVLTSEMQRSVSLLPMIHIALVRRSQVVPTTAHALARSDGPLPSGWAQATGPSRTADIELTLSTGVHGPGVVHIVLFPGDVPD